MPYIGTQPNDVKKNTGLYTPSDILELTKDGSWGGSLELIAEQTYSSAVSFVDFTSIGNNDFLTKGNSINKIEILFNKIEKDNDWFTLSFRSRTFIKWFG